MVMVFKNCPIKPGSKLQTFLIDHIYIKNDMLYGISPVGVKRFEPKHLKKGGCQF